MLLCCRAMKVLVVLVLAVFTGCKANLLSADDPGTTLDDLQETLGNAYRSVVIPVEDFSDRMWETKFGQDLRARLEQGAGVAKTAIQRVKKAWRQTPDEVQRFMGGLSFGIYGLAVTVEEKKTTIKKSLEPLAEKLAPVAENVLSKLAEKTQPVRNAASPYVNKLIERVDSWSKAVPARLDTLYDNFYSSN